MLTHNMSITTILAIGLGLFAASCEEKPQAQVRQGKTTASSTLLPPSDLQATLESSGDVSLTWLDNSDNEKSFNIEACETPDGTWTTVSSSESDTEAAKISASKIQSKHYFRINAVNNTAVSAYSNVVFATSSTSTSTSGTVTFTTPVLTASATSSSQISLSWTASTVTDAKIIIERSANGSSSWSAIQQLSASATSVSDTGLSAVTTYYYRAIFSKDSTTSSYSSTVSATTSANPNAPTAPSALSATASSATQINLSWTDNASNETGFDVEKSTTGTSGWTSVATPAANATSASITGLTAATTYYFRVTAKNADGNSAYTSTASTTTLPLAPTAPGSLTATAASSVQINLTWTDLSSNEASFSLERSADGSTGWTAVASPAANATSASDGSLTASTTYYYRIKAVNTGGSSAYSSVANATTLPPAPTAPSAITATAASSTQINLSWTDNANNEVDFTLERSGDGSTGWTSISSPAADATSASNSSLTANTTYYYRIKANNTGGSSAYSSTASATTYPLAPSAPSALAATAASQTQINLTWTDNANNETGFTLERSADGSTGWASVATPAADATSASNTGLTANTTYYYRIKASNTGGSSSYSSNASATTLPNVPTAPGTLVATASSNSQIDLTWADNSNNETGFILERSADGSTGWTSVATPAANATSASNTSLTSNTAYYYRIRATNTGGDSTNSATANTTTLPDAPSAPSGFAASAGSSSTINLTWTDNANNETGFVIERSANGTTGWASVLTPTANAINDSNTGLSASTTYYYRIKAVNTGGSSAYSSVVNATTSAAPPTAPSALTVTTVSTSELTIGWTDNSTDETGFELERSADGSTGWSLINSPAANASSYSNTSLTTNTTYYYRIRAVGAGGNSSYTSVANGTTSAGMACADGTVEQSFGSNVFGCSGAVTYPNRANLCASGFIACSAVQWNSVAASPTYNYWTNNVLNYNGSISSCYVSLTGGNACGANEPMRVCKSSGSDGVSSNCTWRDCGFDATTPNKYYGGCTGNTTAGTLCCPAPSVPTAPTGLTATTGTMAGTISLSWTDASNNEDEFIIQKSSNGTSGWTELGRPASNATSYTAQTSANTTVYYRIAASNQGGTSSYTAAVSGTSSSESPCADGSMENSFTTTMYGCSGTVSFANRNTLCGTGYQACEPAYWVANRGSVAPTYNYWTNDLLRYSGSGPNSCSAHTVASGGGSDCGATTPMRVCNASGVDGVASNCNWYNCGYNGSTTNNFFGGCSGASTAGTLCCKI